MSDSKSSAATASQPRRQTFAARGLLGIDAASHAPAIAGFRATVPDMPGSLPIPNRYSSVRPRNMIGV